MNNQNKKNYNPKLPQDYDPSQCLTVLHQKDIAACEDLVTQFHCTEAQESSAYHKSCDGQAMYMPVQITTCQSYAGTTQGQMIYYPPDQFFKDCGQKNIQDPDGNWNPGFCFCCCSCFANNTLVAIPNGIKTIQQLIQGDTVTTASLPQGPSTNKIELSTANIDFSSGTGATGMQPLMVYLVYGENAEYETICSPNQPFLLDSGKFIRAGQLVPGKMNLINSAGKTLPLKLAAIGEYSGGVHHISTDAPWDKSPNKHLIVANNAIAGDYDLQTYFDSLPNEWKVENNENLPTIGEKEYLSQNSKYITQNSHSIVFSSTVKSPGTQVPNSNLPFKAYKSTSSQPLPQDVSSFLTEAQAIDVLNNGTFAPFANPIPLALFETVKKQFAGFYPDINFVYDPMNFLPNLYAFAFYGKKYILLTGGLGRLAGFNYEGMAMAMAHGVGAFKGGKPEAPNGFSGVGVADFYAFAAVTRQVWPSDPWVTYSLAAMKQWKALFDLVSPANAAGNPKDPINNPSLDCRYIAVQNGFAGGDLPECAGGGPLPAFYLEVATAPSLSTIQLTFSVGLDTESGSDVTNYTLDPQTPIDQAVINSSKNFIVNLNLKAPLKPSRLYVVTINKNLQSYLGNSIDPNRASLSFKTSSS